MATPWIARLLLTLLGVQVGLCTAFLADEWPSLRQREDAAFRRILDQDKGLGFIVDPSRPIDRQRIVRPLRPGHPSSYLRVDITENKKEPQLTFPQNSTDWAVLLEITHPSAPAIAAIDHPLSWENDSFVTLGNFNVQLELYNRAVLCVDIRRDPVGQPLPDYFKSSAIPLANLEGEPGLLPRANRVVFHPSASAGPKILFGFRNNESSSTGEGLPPAFALWDHVLIPSFPIALAMAQHQVAPQDVHIVLGSHVRLGNGPLIALDEFGRILLPVDDADNLLLPENPTQVTTTAENVIDGKLPAQLTAELPLAPDADTATTLRCALFTDATSHRSAPWKKPADLQMIASAIDILPRPGPPELHLRLPLWLESLLFLLLAALGTASLRLSTLARCLLGPLLIIAALALSIALLRYQGSWAPFTPLLACTSLTWLLTTYLHHKITPQELPT